MAVPKNENNNNNGNDDKKSYPHPPTYPQHHQSYDTHDIGKHIKGCPSAWITRKIIALAPGSNGKSAQGLARLLYRAFGKILQRRCIVKGRNDAGHGFHGFGCEARKSQHPRRTSPAATLYGSSLRSNGTLTSQLKETLIDQIRRSDIQPARTRSDRERTREREITEEEKQRKLSG